MSHGFLAEASSFFDRDGAVFIQHEQLGFVFKAVLQLAHGAELVALGADPGLVHVRQLNAAGVGGGLVRRQVDHDDSVGMAGEGGPLIAHAVVFVGHLMNGAIDVEFPPVVGHLGEVVAEMDEDVAKGLIGPEVLVLLLWIAKQRPSTAMRSPVHRLISLNWIRSISVPPKSIAPMGPLPIGRASVIHVFAGRSYHRHSFPGASARAGVGPAPTPPVPVRGSRPSAVVAREADSRKWRREMTFSGLPDVLLIVVVVNCIIASDSR